MKKKLETKPATPTLRDALQLAGTALKRVQPQVTGKAPEQKAESSDEDANDRILTEVYDLIGVIMKREDVTPHGAASGILVALLMNAVHMGADGFAPDDVMYELTQRMAAHMRMPADLFCYDHRLRLGSEFCEECQSLGSPVKTFAEMDEEGKT